MAEQNRSSDQNRSRDNHSRDKDQDGQYQQKLINVKRTAKVVAGGRNFRFAALVVLGDGANTAGYGRGKAKEVQEAIRKATEMAKKNMIRVHLHKGTVFHELEASHGSTKVTIRPSADGSGIIAGGPMRAIFEVLGVKNISSKCFGSTRAMNVVHATFKALQSMQSPFYIAEKRGLSVARVLNTEVKEEATDGAV
jgi:small subunit ribosomal protein S5